MPGHRGHGTSRGTPAPPARPTPALLAALPPPAAAQSKSGEWESVLRVGRPGAGSSMVSDLAGGGEPQCSVQLG